MIQGRSGGSGKYSYREVHDNRESVQVSHMPDEMFTIRCIFRTQGEIIVPALKMSEAQATCLWAALNLMAKDLGWDDRMRHEIERDQK